MSKIIFNVIVTEFPNLYPCYTYAQKTNNQRWEPSNTSFNSIKEMTENIDFILREKVYKNYAIISNFLVQGINEAEGDFKRGEGIHSDPFCGKPVDIEIRKLTTREKSNLIKELFILQHKKI